MSLRSTATVARRRPSEENSARTAGVSHSWVTSTMRTDLRGGTLGVAPVEPAVVGEHPQPPAVPIELDRRGQAAGQREMLLVSRQVPQLHLGALAAAGEQAPAFGMEGQAADEGRMPAEDGPLDAGPGIPDADGRVNAGRRHVAAVGAERDALHRAVMAAELEPQLAGRGIPDPGGIGRDGQQRAVGAEGELGAFLPEVPRLAHAGIAGPVRQAPELAARRRVVELHGGEAAHRDHPAVGAVA